MTYSLSMQVAEVEREIAKRREDYPRLVAKGKLRQSEAERLIAIMAAVRDTLVGRQK